MAAYCARVDDPAAICLCVDGEDCGVEFYPGRTAYHRPSTDGGLGEDGAEDGPSLQPLFV